MATLGQAVKSGLAAMASGPSPTHLCRNCGSQVRPATKSSVNGCFLLVLLCFFIIPGILYWVWAGTSKKNLCPICKAENTLIPLDTPEAQRLLVQR